VSLLIVTASFAADDGLVSWWKFDDKSEKTTVDSISRVRDEINGNFKYVSGRQIRRGKDFRFGHRRMLEGTDLIIWIKMDSAKPLLIELAPSGN